MLLRVVLHPDTFRMQNIIPHLLLKFVAVIHLDAFHRIKFDVIPLVREILTRQKLIGQFPHLARVVFRSALAPIIQAAELAEAPLLAAGSLTYAFATQSVNAASLSFCA